MCVSLFAPECVRLTVGGRLTAGGRLLALVFLRYQNSKMNDKKLSVQTIKKKDKRQQTKEKRKKKKEKRRIRIRTKTNANNKVIKSGRGLNMGGCMCVSLFAPECVRLTVDGRLTAGGRLLALVFLRYQNSK
jgi:hypothetical protein